MCDGLQALLGAEPPWSWPLYSPGNQVRSASKSTPKKNKTLEETDVSARKLFGLVSNLLTFARFFLCYDLHALYLHITPQ